MTAEPLMPPALEKQLEKGNQQLRIRVENINQNVRLSHYDFKMLIIEHSDPLKHPWRRRQMKNRLINLYRLLDKFIFTDIQIHSHGIWIRGRKRSPRGRTIIYQFYVEGSKLLDPYLLHRIRDMAKENNSTKLPEFYDAEFSLEDKQMEADLIAELFGDIFREYALSRRRRGRPRKYPLNLQGGTDGTNSENNTPSLMINK